MGIIKKYDLSGAAARTGDLEEKRNVKININGNEGVLLLYKTNQR